jgi:hypothetical protein
MDTNDERFELHLARALCLVAGDSWVSDRGARDQYLADAQELLDLIDDLEDQEP